MKYIIIGMHCSGKQEVADILENNGVRCGRLFTNLDNPSAPNIYNGSNYEQYTSKDINDIFENNAYVFMQEFPFGEETNISAYKYYEGLSLYAFENNGQGIAQGLVSAADIFLPVSADVLVGCKLPSYSSGQCTCI